MILAHLQRFRHRTHQHTVGTALEIKPNDFEFIAFSILDHLPLTLAFVKCIAENKQTNQKKLNRPIYFASEKCCH